MYCALSVVSLREGRNAPPACRTTSQNGAFPVGAAAGGVQVAQNIPSATPKQVMRQSLYSMGFLSASSIAACVPASASSSRF